MCRERESARARARVCVRDRGPVTDVLCVCVFVRSSPRREVVQIPAPSKTKTRKKIKNSCNS